MSEFNDYVTSRYHPHDLAVIFNRGMREHMLMAFNAGRKLQREKDAAWVKECSDAIEKELGQIDPLGPIVKAILEQEIE